LASGRLSLRPTKVKRACVKAAFPSSDEGKDAPTWLEQPLATEAALGDRVCVPPKTISRLQYARYQRLSSQPEIAARVGVSRQTISSLENGRSIPSVTLALAIARALGTTVEQLWG
jgi:putative transcriptional regulator